MDRRARLIACAAAAALGAGCGARAASAPLAAGAGPTAPAVGLAHRADLAEGLLTYAVGFSDDGRLLVSVELDDAFYLVVRDLSGLPATPSTRVRLGPAEHDVVDLAVEGARRAWVASSDGLVRAYDLTGGGARGPETTWHLGDATTAVAVSDDGRHVATGSRAGVLCLRRARDGALLQCVVAHDAPVSALAFAPGEAGLLASASWDGSAVLWDVPSLAVVARRRFPGSVNDLAFEPQARPGGGRRLALARSLAPPVRTAALAAAERRGDAPTAPAPVTLWSPGGGAVDLLGHQAPITAIAWTPDGARVISASWDRSVRLWDPARGRALARTEGFAHLVTSVAVDPGGRLVAAGAWTAGASGRATALFDLRYPVVTAPAH
jgi:WD40 repeat protein